jgi:hypothetical protein
MFKPVRVVATVLLFGAIVMTFISAFILPTILCIIFVIVSSRFLRCLRIADKGHRSNISPSSGYAYLNLFSTALMSTQYSLSYIPFARTVRWPLTWVSRANARTGRQRLGWHVSEGEGFFSCSVVWLCITTDDTHSTSRHPTRALPPS